MDSPAKIAILGAGPIGLETALYARFLGFEIELIERGLVAHNVLDWGHVRMFSPFHMNSTRLAIAAISAQDKSYEPPAPEELLTGRGFADRYLIPLASTDLLSDRVVEGHTVQAVGREGWLKQEGVGSNERAAAKFRILSRDVHGNERTTMADFVIDATGSYGNPRWMGDAGIPAIGETELIRQITYRVPDALGRERTRYERRHTLVVGGGFSAATSIVLLGELADAVSNTRVTWLTRTKRADAGPIPVIENDRLTSRSELAHRANRLALDSTGPVHWINGVSIRTVEKNGDGFRVWLTGESTEALDVDNIVANTGYLADAAIYRELQVHECYATGGPMKLAALLARDNGQDCLEQTAHGASSLTTTEPNFYIVGCKSYGRDSRFLLAIGHRQIRDLFAMIADRAELDLYNTIQL